jgi:hypothetical protein
MPVISKRLSFVIGSAGLMGLPTGDQAPMLGDVV